MIIQIKKIVLLSATPKDKPVELALTLNLLKLKELEIVQNLIINI